MKLVERIKDSFGIFTWINSNFSKFLISVQRIEEFLHWDEVENSIVELINDETNINAIEISNSNFFWGFNFISEEDVIINNKRKTEVKEKCPNEVNKICWVKEDSSKNIEQFIEVNKDIKIFEDKVVLKSINLKVEKGEFIAIIGNVGSGKSSLLSCILGDMLYIDNSIIK